MGIPLKSNRKVDDSGGVAPHRAVSELEHGKWVNVHGFAKDTKVKLFRGEMSCHRTDSVVTSDWTQDSARETRKVCAVRWKIERYHRELKQLTGIENCQCRKARIQRNHAHCALLVWTRLNDLAHQTQFTVYQLKHGLLKDSRIQQLKTPAISMRVAQAL